MGDKIIIIIIIIICCIREYTHTHSLTMLIQVLGRHEAGDRYGTVTLPQKVLPDGYLELTLINFFVCTDAAHNLHFEPPVQQAYPEQEPYAEFINVRVPRQVRITGNRRRTVNFRNYEQQQQQQFVDDGDVRQRYKRSMPDDDQLLGVKRVRRAVEGLDLEVTSSFSRSEVIVFEESANLAAKSSTGFATFFNTKLAPKRRTGFQTLFKNNFSLGTAPSAADARSGRVIINIPPRNKIGFIGNEAIEYLTGLGFEPNKLITVDEIITRPDGTDVTLPVSYFVNEDYAEMATVAGTRNVKFSTTLETNFTTFQRTDFPRGGLKTMSNPNGVAVKFELLDRVVSFGCSLTELDVPERNRQFTVAFFQHILEDVESLLQFNPNLLNVAPGRSGTQLAFTKLGTPDKDDAVKLTIHFDLGARLAQKLGFTIDPERTDYLFDWRPLAGAKHTAVTEPLENDDTDNPLSHDQLKKYVSDMRIALTDLKGDFPTLAQFRQRAVDLRATRDYEADMMRQNEERRQARLAAEAAEAALRNPPPPDVVAEEDQPPVVIPVQPEIVVVAVAAVQQEVQPPVVIPVNPEVVVVDDAAEEQEVQPPPIVIVVAAEVDAEPAAQPVEEQEAIEEAAGGGDGDDDDDDEPEEILGEFDVIQIPNPTPRRPRTFETLKNAPTVRLHPAPIAFPLEFTLLVREGEPLDYIADRGYVSILGQIRSNPPHVIPNKCLLKNTGQRISQFKIEILDSHMNSWKLAEVDDDRQRAAYFKLDFFCKQIKY